MRFTTRGQLVVAATGLLAALAVGLPSQAERSPEPVVEFATATCSGSGELDVEFLLTDAIGAPAHPEFKYVVVSTHVRSGPESEPLHDSELAGTLIPGAEVPPPGEGSLSGMTVVPGDTKHVVLEAEVDRTSADGTERIVVEGEAVLKECAPVVPEQAVEHEHGLDQGTEQGTEQGAENPSRVWGPYGGKRTIPTHQDPAGGQTTHPSVVRVPGGWNGYEYWMAHTPYPGSNSAWEDPNIAASNDGVTWVVPPGLTNPLDDQPGLPGPYNSDTDLEMGPNNTLYAFWRVVIPDLSQERIKYSTSTDGVNWSAPVEAMRSAMADRRPVSPAFMYENGAWKMWAIEINRSPNRMVFFQGGATPAKANWGAMQTVTLGPMQKEKEPWHLSMTKNGNAYIGLLNDTALASTGRDGDLLFLYGTTPISFSNSTFSTIPRLKPFMHDHLYRASMLVGTEYGVPGYQVWYSARMALNPDVWNVQQTFLNGVAAHGGP
jgi:hypothetical protein